MRASKPTSASPPHRPDRPLLQGAQQLRLHAEGHLADFVEKKRSSRRLDEEPLARQASVGEGSSRVAKELALEERLRHGGAVDRDERAVGASAPRVNGTSHQLLPGPTLTGHQDRDLGLGHSLNELKCLRHPGTGTHHVLEGRPRELGAQSACFSPQHPLARGPFERRGELGDVERLGHVVVRTRADGAHGRLLAAECRHHDDRHVSPRLDDARAEVDAADASHLNVREHDIHVFRLEQGQHVGFGGRGRNGDQVPPLFQIFGEDGAPIRVVIDDQYVLRHGASLSRGPQARRVPGQRSTMC
jgi:hypothetical protein